MTSKSKAPHATSASEEPAGEKTKRVERRDAECAEKESEKDGEELDPGVRRRRRISFKSTNLIGSIQDDVNGKRKMKLAQRVDLGQRKKFLRWVG